MFFFKEKYLQFAFMIGYHPKRTKSLKELSKEKAVHHWRIKINGSKRVQISLILSVIARMRIAFPDRNRTFNHHQRID